MSKRSEEAAMKAYPKKEAWNKNATGHYDPNFPRRKAYLQGYEQAEKDTIERAVAWLKDYVKHFEIYDEKGVEEFRKAMEDEE